MTPDPQTCTPRTSLAAAGQLLLESDCGILPVVEDGKLVGVVTDRDMFIALATRNKPASELTVGEVATRSVFTCSPEDDAHVPLAIMRDHRVRRVPVVGFGGTIAGIISMNDTLLASGADRPVTCEEVVAVCQAICAHHLPAPPVVV